MQSPTNTTANVQEQLLTNAQCYTITFVTPTSSQNNSPKHTYTGPLKRSISMNSFFTTDSKEETNYNSDSNDEVFTEGNEPNTSQTPTQVSQHPRGDSGIESIPYDTYSITEKLTPTEITTTSLSINFQSITSSEYDADQSNSETGSNCSDKASSLEFHFDHINFKNLEEMCDSQQQCIKQLFVLISNTLQENHESNQEIRTKLDQLSNTLWQHPITNNDGLLIKTKERFNTIEQKLDKNNKLIISIALLFIILLIPIAFTIHLVSVYHKSKTIFQAANPIIIGELVVLAISLLLLITAVSYASHLYLADNKEQEIMTRAETIYEPHHENLLERSSDGVNNPRVNNPNFISSSSEVNSRTPSLTSSTSLIKVNSTTNSYSKVAI